MNQMRHHLEISNLRLNKLDEQVNTATLVLVSVKYVHTCMDLVYLLRANDPTQQNKLIKKEGFS